MSFLKPKAAKSTSSSENVNNQLITSTYGGMMNQGTNANNYLSALLTGTGKIDAPQNNGNADVLIGTDGAHPTPDGHVWVAQTIARWFLANRESL